MNGFALALPGGITLDCRGERTDARVMLVHGFPEAAFVWDEVIEALAPDVRCVAPNLRGFGAPSPPSEPSAYRPRALVADLAAAIEALGAPLDLLVAHDWGGALAWSLAAQRPDLLRRLMIVNAPHPAAFLRELRGNPRQQQASAYMNFFCRPDAAALLAEEDYRRLWRSFEGAAWLTPEVKARYRAVWDRGLEQQLNYYRGSPLRPPASPEDAIHTLVLPDEAVTVRVPTTVLWGERDHALLPALLDGLERWVPDLQVVRVPEASHWIVHEQPALVAGTIATALQRTI